MATSTATAAKAGDTVDAAALLKQAVAAAKNVKTQSAKIDMTLTVPGTQAQAMKMESVMDQSQADHVKAKMTMNLGTVAMEMVIDGENYYIKLADVWYKTTKAQIEKTSGSVTSAVDQASMIEKLQSGVKQAVLVGDDTVEGTATKHYKLTLDAGAFSGIAGGTSTAAPTVTEDFPYDIWLDSAGLTRKVDLEVLESGTGMAMTATFGNFNEPVTIEIPKDAKALPGTS